MIIGRNGGDIRVAELNELSGVKLEEISSIHFTLSKRNMTDIMCPVILEVRHGDNFIL